MGETLSSKLPRCRCREVQTHSRKPPAKGLTGLELGRQGRRPVGLGGICRRVGAHLRERKAKTHQRECHQTWRNRGRIPSYPRSAGRQLRGRPSPGCHDQEDGAESRHTQQTAPKSKRGTSCGTCDLLPFSTNKMWRTADFKKLCNELTKHPM